MVELNQNKNPNQPNQPDAVWEFCFILEIGKYHN